MKQTIRKGDNVRVTRGDKADVGKVGEIIRVLRGEDRVVVQGVNMVKKHQKQQQSGGKTIPSGIMEFEAPVHISNVELVTDTKEKETKVTAAKKPAVKAEKKTSAKPAAKKTAEAKPAVKKTAESKPAAAKKPAATAKDATAKKPAVKKPAVKKTADK